MKLINHKYLKEINVTPVQQLYKEDSYLPLKLKNWLKCRKNQKIQMKEGFNPMETWDLEQSFYQWLYEGLRSYVDHASKVIDLDLNIEWLSLKYLGKSYTQRQLTELLLEKLEFVLRIDKDWKSMGFKYTDAFKKRREVGKEIHDIWKILAPESSW